MAWDPAFRLPVHCYPLAQVQKMRKIAHVAKCFVRPVPRALCSHVLHEHWGVLVCTPCTSMCSYPAASRHLRCSVVCAKPPQNNTKLAQNFCAGATTFSPATVCVPKTLCSPWCAPTPLFPSHQLYVPCSKYPIPQHLPRLQKLLSQHTGGGCVGGHVSGKWRGRTFLTFSCMVMPLVMD